MSGVRVPGRETSDRVVDVGASGTTRPETTSLPDRRILTRRHLPTRLGDLRTSRYPPTIAGPTVSAGGRPSKGRRTGGV